MDQISSHLLKLSLRGIYPLAISTALSLPFLREVARTLVSGAGGLQSQPKETPFIGGGHVGAFAPITSPIHHPLTVTLYNSSDPHFDR